MKKIIGIVLIALSLSGCLSWVHRYPQNNPHTDPRQRPHIERPEPDDRDRETIPEYPGNGRDRNLGDNNE